MGKRLDMQAIAPELNQAFVKAELVIAAGPLDRGLAELLKLRASQLNGCVFCVDMHTHALLDGGEKADRIYQLVTWRESEMFTPAERAALAYTEAATVLGADGVPDAVWDEMAAAFDAREQAYLAATVAMINLWNRLSVPVENRPPAR